MIQVVKFPYGLQFTVVEFPLCSLYFSSLLASLNAREYVKGTTPGSSNETPVPLTPRRGTGENLLFLGSMKKSKASDQESGITVVWFIVFLTRSPIHLSVSCTKTTNVFQTKDMPVVPQVSFA